MKKIQILLIFAFVILVATVSITSMIDDQLISYEEARKRIREGKIDTILDIRAPIYYDQSHIPNAISMPLPTLEKSIRSTVRNNESTILVYSDSVESSKKAAHLLRDIGYLNVFFVAGRWRQIR